MARNSEKQYGRLNRLILLKEKEEYEKNNPLRPKLDSLQTVEEIQKWLPSIKRDIVFYLNKSQVTCYTDQHVEECRMKVIKLEKEFKAFVRKIKQLTPGTLDAVPWTSRAYKRKNSDPIEIKEKKQFVPITCNILGKEKPILEASLLIEELPLMDEPLSFNLDSKKSTKLGHSDFNPNAEPLCEEICVENACILSSKSSELISSELKDNLQLMDEPLSFSLDSKKDAKLEHSDLNPTAEPSCEETCIKNACILSSKSKSSELISCELKDDHIQSSVKIVNYDYSSDSDSS